MKQGVRERRDLGSDFGDEVVLLEGRLEVLEGERDSFHGGGEAALIGFLEDLLELLPLLLGRGECVGTGDDGCRAEEAPRRRLGGCCRGWPRKGRGRKWRASETGELVLHDARHG